MNSHSPPSISLDQPTPDRMRITVGGRWSLGASPDTAKAHAALSAGCSALDFSAEALDEWDSSLVIFLLGVIRRARQSNMEVDQSGLPAGLNRLIALAFAVPEREGAARNAIRASLLERVGEASLSIPRKLGDILEFLGEATISLSRFLRGRANFRWRDLLLMMQQTGASALPIVTLISLLLGLILAFVGAVQLRVFGAQIYVASLVGIAMVRVMGAVMTGIAMAGRTGASYAAVLGTMQVNEEVDALVTLGVSPMDFLVLPRTLALVLMMPLLTIYANVMGIAGGYIVGVTVLGLNPMEYLMATKAALSLANVWIGLIHSVVFGVVIALSGCFFGMRCGRSSSAVGDATTSAVVSGIIGIIVVTALITVMCEVIGV
ncbi:MAG: ABC transporter permease [Humidesulfovibrio sp.]|nr:ABC transporter permease [Humidesulfovibrio sp.]